MATRKATTSSRGISSRDRILLVLAIVGIAVAAGAIYVQIKKQMPHEVARINLPTGGSPKAQWMKTHGKGAALPSTGDSGPSDPTQQ